MRFVFDQQAYLSGVNLGARAAEKYLDRKEREEQEKKVEDDRATKVIQAGDNKFGTMIDSTNKTLAGYRASMAKAKNTRTYNAAAKSYNIAVNNVLSEAGKMKSASPMVASQVQTFAENNAPAPLRSDYEVANVGFKGTSTVTLNEGITDEDRATLRVAEDGTVVKAPIKGDGTYDETQLNPVAKPYSYDGAGAKGKESDLKSAYNAYVARTDSPMPIEKFKTTLWTKEAKRRQTPLEQKKETWNDLKAAKANYTNNPSEESKSELDNAKRIYSSLVEGKKEAGEIDDKADAKKATSYGRDIVKDGSKYNTETAENLEIDFRYTDAYLKNKPLQKLEDNFEKSTVSYNQNKSLYDIFAKAVDDGEYKSGVVDAAKKAVVKYTPTEFRDLIGLDSEAIKKELGLEGQIGDGVATYLKGLSGTAAAQAEFVRTLNNFVGSNFAQEDVRESIFSNFVTKKKRDTDILAKKLAKRGLAYTAGQWLYGEAGTKTMTKQELGKLSPEDRKKWIASQLKL